MDYKSVLSLFTEMQFSADFELMITQPVINFF